MIMMIIYKKKFGFILVCQVHHCGAFMIILLIIIIILSATDQHFRHSARQRAGVGAVDHVLPLPRADFVVHREPVSAVLHKVHVGQATRLHARRHWLLHTHTHTGRDTDTQAVIQTQTHRP